MDSKIPNIRFKGFTDAWEQRRLGEVTIYQNGKGYEDSQSSSGKFELINLNSISIDGGLKSSGKYIESADKVGMKISVNEKTRTVEVSYYLNGENLGVAFDSLELNTYYPSVVMLYECTKVKLIDKALMPEDEI